MPAVSIILPVFNAGSTVALALDSIQRQTFPDWELLVVDDGSSDATPAVVDSWAIRQRRIRLLKRAHAGLVPALNAGIAQARASLIARMDADDVAHPERLAEQVKLLRDRPQIGVAGCLVAFGGDAAAARGYALHVDWINSLVTPEEIAMQRFVESPFAHPSVLFRRELIERHGGYRDGDFPEDYELWLRWLDAGVRMAKVPKTLLTWCDRPDRLSRKDSRYDPEAFYRCKALYLARWLHQHVDRARAILVWGAGRPTRRRAAHLLSHGIVIAGYIDIDPRKIGRSFSARPVWAPEAIPPARECFVLGYVAKRGARELARGHLQSRGFVQGQDFLMCA